MPLLRMRNASFTRGSTSVGPFTFDVGPGERTTLECASVEHAKIAALLAAGIVKASGGSVLIGDYDPRIQSVHCKRIVALVPHEPTLLPERDFTRYILYRAALWNVDATQALTEAARLRERLGELHEAFVYPLVGALIGMPRIVVLDRPAAAYATQIFAAIGSRAAVSTHVGHTPSSA